MSVVDVAAVVTKIVQLNKGIVADVVANPSRCKRLSDRLLALKPAIEAFKAVQDRGEDASADALARTLCVLVEEISAFVAQYNKFKGRGPKIRGKGVADCVWKVFNRDDDKVAFDGFNVRLTDFSATLSTLIQTKTIDTKAWANEDKHDEQADEQQLMSAVSGLKETNAQQHAEIMAALNALSSATTSSPDQESDSTLLNQYAHEPDEGSS